MKRFFALILALILAVSLAGCGKKEDEADKEPVDPDESTDIHYEELNVEFVVGDRSASELMALQKELPSLLTAALAQESCAVGQINVTFGASADATARSLQSGSVDIAFLPSETALTCGVPLRLNAVENVSVPAGECFPDIDFSEVSGIDADSLIYENVVVCSNDTPETLGAAFERALVRLCASVDGNAVMRHYGSASYLIYGYPGALLDPLKACLTLAPQE